MTTQTLGLIIKYEELTLDYIYVYIYIYIVEKVSLLVTINVFGQTNSVVSL